VPSFTISRRAHGRVRFAGLPMGHEFTSLVLALLWAGGHPPKVAQSRWIDQGLPGGNVSRCISRSPATTAPMWCRR
jgi:alkyl hydroperoxide reductase subunit F